MTHPTIMRGSTGQAVKDAQQNLVDRGYDIGPAGVDGIFGNHTYHALTALPVSFGHFRYPWTSTGLSVRRLGLDWTLIRSRRAIRASKSGFCKASSKTLETQILIPGLWTAFSALTLKWRSRTTKHSPASQAMVWLTQKTGCICGANTGTSIA